MVEVRILGPVEVVDVDGRNRRLRGQRPATILLTLSLAAGTVVSPERLVLELWGEQVPATALGSLQSHLSRLRRAVEPELLAHAPSAVLLREGGGYRLSPHVTVDARVFEQEVAAVREQLVPCSRRSQLGGAGGAVGDATPKQDRVAAALARLHAALGLWRGEVGEGLEVGGGNRAEVRRLEELRLAALETRFEVELGLGRHADVAIELEALVARYPVREHLQALLMLALYRCGRQADALATFRRAREQLVETLGVEPSRQLTELHDRVLGHDPGLEPAEPEPGPAGSTAGAAALTPRAAASTGMAEAAPERTSDPSRPRLGNLPVPLVDLVGRAEQRTAIAATLGPHRLVTLTGAGGCGKTQLALAVANDIASRYPDGAWWVDLQSREDPDLVASTLAEVLAVDVTTAGALEDALVARLRERRALLVVDSCEHLIDGCAHLVRELLLRCPELHLLTTSRQPLDLDGERVWRVPSLAVPAADADLAGIVASEAGQLLLRLGGAARPGFAPGEEDAPHLAVICRELDGIPLALELAAARLRVLSAEELAERLDDRFRLLRSSRRGAPPRHRTLDAAIRWSFELLDGPAQRLLCRLAVFRSGASLEAVEAVCADEQLSRDDVLGLLEELVDRSLVTTVPRAVGPTSHDLLTSIRSFAADRLAPDEMSTLRRRHAGWYAGLAERAARELTGPEQVRWLNRLHDEHDDLRAALDWSLQEGEVDLAARVGAGVWWFWLQFGHAREGASWLERILAAAATPGGSSTPAPSGSAAVSGVTPLHAELEQQVAYAAGRLSAAAGAPDRARLHLERGADLARHLDAPCRVALCRARLLQLDPVATRPLLPPGDADADADVEAARCGDPWVEAAVADVSGYLAAAADDLDAAADAFRRSETAYLEVEDRWSACLSRLGRAWVARRRGRWTEALELHLENLAATRALTRSAYDFVGLARDLRGVAAAACTVGHHASAAHLCGASENLRSLGEVALEPDERSEVEQVLLRIRDALGAGIAEQEQAAGRALSGGQALELAATVAAQLLETTSQREVLG